MFPSTNTCSGPTSLIETIDIVPPNPHMTPYIKISDLDYTIKYIHADMKSYIDKTDTNIKSMN